MKPQDHKTSITFSHATYLILQTLLAQRKEWSQSDAVNASLHFYYKYADNPELDAMTAHLATISKRLDDLLTRSAPTIDTEALAAALVAALAAQTPPAAAPVPVEEVTPPAPTPTPTKPRWAERFRQRFGKPPPEHW